MTSPNTIALVGILQRHGLSVELLELLVSHCQQKRTGGFNLYTSQGRFVRYEERSCGPVMPGEPPSGTGSDPVLYGQT